LAVDLAVVEEEYVVGIVCAHAFYDAAEYLGSWLLDAHLAG
jgi:hypothetical protein